MMGGLAYMTGPKGQPLRAGASVIDIMGGSYGVIGILTALYEREKTGEGKYVVATLFESTVFLMGQHMTFSAITGEPAPPMPERVSAWAIYDRFQTQEGEMVFIGITSDRHWKRFCETFQVPALAGDERLATNNDRISQRTWLIPELQKIFKTLPKKKLFQLCEKAEIPFAPIAKPEDLFDDPHLKHGGGLLETILPGGRRAKLPRIPLRVGSYDFGLRNNPPELGEGSQELLQELGFTQKEINELRREKILSE